MAKRMVGVIKNDVMILPYDSRIPFAAKGGSLIKKDLIDPDPHGSSPLEEPSTNYIATSSTTPQEQSRASPVTTPIATPLLAPQPNASTIVTSHELVFTIPLTLPHPYLNNLKDLPLRCINSPPFPTLEEIVSQPLPLTNHIDVEPFFPPSNLSRRNTRLSAFPEPNLTQAQIIEELNELQDISNIIDMALQNT
uniref:Uncharacterized protein n=1 Tax=Tanacetum cinerariifolium TaxID=118510 RepID=A0A699H7B0_TANCI|nr:hypothetical protein [Tanacetum cinerariifolium]